MNVKDVFINDAGRLRSGWRFLIFLFVFIFISLPVTETANRIVPTLPPGFSQNIFLVFITPILIFAVIAIFLGWLFGYLIEDLPFRALGLWFTGNWAKDLAFGIIIGAISIGFASLIAITFGGLSFQLNQTAETPAILNTLGSSLVIFIIAAVSEEALFRGYLLQTLTRARLAWGGIILTSVIFASAHNANPNADLFSWLNTFLAGVWFAVAYLKTRNLWFPIGVHLAWNWIQGAFLGINVSGLKELTAAPILQAIDQGPTWLTGGHYGIEGGAACTIALAASTVLIWYLPFLKPTAEMLQLSGEENLKIQKEV